MAKTYANAIANRKQTAVTQPIPNREKEMVLNNSSSYTFQVSDMDFVDRFLILGTEGSTYYQGEKKLTEAAATKVKEVIKTNGVAVVERAAEVSDKGLSTKNSTSIFTLALASTYGDEKTKKAVNENINKVCRTGQHILEFSGYVSALRGFGRSIRAGINNWYTSKNENDLGFQLCKYANRDGWKHSDVFRLTHPRFDENLNESVIKYVMGKESAKKAEIVQGFELAKQAKSVKELLGYIEKYKLPREAIPTQYLNDVAVWENLLVNMPLTATIRNLGKMTSLGMFNGPFNKNLNLVNEKILDKEYVKKSRLHPLGVLVALRTYSSGHGLKGSLSWSPNASIINNLDECFYLTFNYIQPSGKRILYALDVSGSMGSSLSNSPITCAEATAAMSMALARTEKNHYIMGFAHTFRDLGIDPKDKLEAALKKVVMNNFGSTNCSLPFTWAEQNKVDFDMAVVMTDNEVNNGIYPTQAIRKYRSARNNPDVKMVCCAFTATKFSIADPQDKLQLDVAGLSPDLPQVLTTFANLGDKVEKVKTKRGSKAQVEENDD